MNSNEIRNYDPIAHTVWEEPRGIGEQIYELTKQAREIAAQLAIANERAIPQAAPASEPAAPEGCSIVDNEVLADLYIRVSGKTTHASDCATSVAPAETPGPCDCDAVPQPLMHQEAACVPEPNIRGALLAEMQHAYIEGSKHHPPCATDVCCVEGMRQAARVIVEALREEGNRVEDIRAAREGDVGTGEFGRILSEAISNLLPEVKS